MTRASGLVLASMGAFMLADHFFRRTWFGPMEDRATTLWLGEAMHLAWMVLLFAAGVGTTCHPVSRRAWGLAAAVAGIGLYGAHEPWSLYLPVRPGVALGASLSGALLAWAPRARGGRRTASRLDSSAVPRL